MIIEDIRQERPTKMIMKNDTTAIYLLELQNQQLKRKVEELQTQLDELSDSYDMEIEVKGMIIRTDVEHLEEVITKLYELSKKLN